MAVPYEVAKPPRFVVETIADGEQIRIRAPRPVFAGLFMAFWLCAWTVAGLSVLHALMVKGFQPFLGFWLCGWAFGEGFVLLLLVWMLGGSEVVRIVGGDLEISAEIFGFTRTKRYRGADIHGLGAFPVPYFGNRQMTLPMFLANRFGAVKFSYGARTVYVAAGLDEPEGRAIVDRILERLPSAAR